MLGDNHEWKTPARAFLEDAEFRGAAPTLSASFTRPDLLDELKASISYQNECDYRDELQQ